MTIGGGEISGLETLDLDSFVCKETCKRVPAALFIPTASGDAKGYCEAFESVYGRKLGCAVDTLLLFGVQRLNKDDISKILRADLIYVGGGNTERMLEVWRDLGVDKILRQAGENGAILSGLSAGGICWYESGLSDSDRFKGNSDWSLKRIQALGFLPGMFCPHLDKEQRHVPLERLVISSGERAIACDNGAAIYWDNGLPRVLTSLPDANAYVYSKCNNLIKVDKFGGGDFLCL